MGERDLHIIIVGFGIALLVVRAVEILARRLGIFDVPKLRGMHEVPTPRVGGVGLVLGTVIGTLLGGSPVTTDMAIVLGGGAVLWLAGVVDDVHPLRVGPRLGVQIGVGLVAAVLIAPSLMIDLPWVSFTVGGWLAVMLSTIWIVGAVNAMNFIDGTDGMAASLILASIPAALILTGAPTDPLLLALAGSCAGFLVWNHHPASIFMGDGGSQFLGFVAATMLLVGGGAPVSLVAMALALAPLILDTVSTVVRRSLAGNNPLTPHDSHLYQRLARIGVGQRTVVAFYAAATLGWGYAAVQYSDVGEGVQLALLVTFTLGGTGAAFAAHELETRVERGKPRGTLGSDR